MRMLHAKSSEDCGDIGFLTETDPDTITVYFDAEELVRRPKFVIFYLSESFTLTLIATLVAAYRYDMEILSTYRRIRIPSLRRQRLGSAEDCANPRESRKALILSCHNRGACLRP